LLDWLWILLKAIMVPGYCWL